MIRTHEEHLAHYGILRRSGRYPWGSGGTENVRNRSFLDTIGDLRSKGMSEAEIARSYGIKLVDLRAARSIALAQQKQQKILTAQRLKERGWSNVAIGERMGLNESSVRALLAPGEKDKADALETTANMIKSHVDKKDMIDVGEGVHHQIGVTKTRLDTAVARLREQGYNVYRIKVQQIATGKFTDMKILAKPGLSLSDVQRNRSNVKQINEYSIDHGRSFLGTQPPINVSSRRIAINYAPAGAKADGVIFVRPGVKDLSIGSNRYGQVRIAVDGTHYMKGMAVYKDDLPPGVDLQFNTNKSKTVPLKTKNPDDDSVLKPMLDDPDLPFGAIVRQIHGPDGKVTSAINMVGSPTKEGSGEEGHWDTWSKNLSSQMLSKQSPALAKQQLDLTFERRKKELDEIMSLTNPTVRRNLLEKFADSTDSSAVHLQAASLPRQATKVILPLLSIKPHEIYAPTMRDGERVVLVRHPHGGPFEIPELTVNNRNREARKILGNAAKDAVGIHHTVAEHLSGADFDGDTVLVIPNNKKQVDVARPLEGLKGFDPQVYKLSKDSPIPRISSDRKQNEMGRISNLITDMTIKGANTEELSRALKHSMVVIDSEKHGLDWRQSEKDNGISSLKQKYQGGKNRGASTLISRAGAVQFVPERVPRPAKDGGPIDKVTGKKVFVDTGRMIPVRKTVRDPNTGEKIRVTTDKLTLRKIPSKKLAETDDAHTLVSDQRTRMELIYADHSNKLKAMANAARKEAVHTRPIPYSPSARKVYSKEVASLTSKLNVAERNAPYERQAQLVANALVAQKRQATPHMEPSEVKKVKQQALNVARIRTGAKKSKIILTQEEWNAIQAGAISTHKLSKILLNSEPDTIKKLAIPRSRAKMTSTMLLRAQAMLASGYTQIEVADQLGIGLTTLKLGLNE